MNVSKKLPIRLEAVSKCYRIFKNPQDRFKQALIDNFQGLIGVKSSSPLYREHWALRDITFELHPGEAVGVLGRNGAGKSTLLQIITGTVEPTAGIVQTSGRITALLELGSGFNPEFTGRENVILNAQILGLSREDALARFDEIASFADIGDFLDQPVKTYSSGMMMRLAFSVQTAVEPKVLIVDEALSVGDVFFQAKCMARIKKLINNGVSILLVSHDVGTIRQICGKSLILVNGSNSYFGNVSQGADMYTKTYLSQYNDAAKASNHKEISLAEYSSRDATSEFSTDESPLSIIDEYGSNSKYVSKDNAIFLRACDFERLGNNNAKFINVWMTGETGSVDCFAYGEWVTISQLVKFKKKLSNVNISYKIRTIQGFDAVYGDIRLFGDISKNYTENASYLFQWRIKLNIGHGSYSLTSSMAHPPDSDGRGWEFLDFIPLSYHFSVLPRTAGMIDGLCVFEAELEVLDLH